MFKHFYIIALSAALLALASCSKDENEPVIASDKEPLNIVATVLTGPFAPNETGPRMVIEAGGWNIIEYRTNGEEHDEMTHLHFLNPDYNASIVISGFDKGTIIYEYDMQSRRASQEVFLTHEEGNYFIVTRCLMNWETMEYSILSESVAELNSNRAPTRGKFEDDIRSIVIRHLENLGSNVDMFCEVASWFSKLPVISYIGTIWTDVAIPAVKYQLLEDVPESTQEIANEVISNYANGISFSLIPSKHSRVEKVAKYAINKVAPIYPSWEPTDEKVKESWGIMTRLSNRSYPVIVAIDGYTPAYKVDLKVTDVTETSAVLNGSFTALGSSYPVIGAMGYKVVGPDYNEDYKSDMLNPLPIGGLKPGTQYTVTAYLNTIEHRYEQTVRFYTEMSLSLIPSSLVFPTEGGSRGVALSIPPEILKSWDIVSKPKWCAIEKGASSFFVDVDASKKERSGEIVVNAVTLNGKSYTASVDVQQKKVSWDGTKWECKGTYTRTMKGNVENHTIKFGIDIRSVADNDFSLSGDIGYPGNHYKIRLEGDKVVLEDNNSTSISSYKDVIVLTRTGHSELSFTYTGKEDVSVWGDNYTILLEGQGTGTLVNE